MTRTAVTTGVAAIVVAALGIALLLVGPRPGDPGQSPTRAQSDSVWYHASDVALLANTGRPQLVEFFHPG